MTLCETKNPNSCRFRSYTQDRALSMSFELYFCTSHLSLFSLIPSTRSSSMIYCFVSFNLVSRVADGEVPEQVQSMERWGTLPSHWFRNFALGNIITNFI